jgi:hypothetical protein
LPPDSELTIIEDSGFDNIAEWASIIVPVSAALFGAVKTYILAQKAVRLAEIKANQDIALAAIRKDVQVSINGRRVSLLTADDSRIVPLLQEGARSPK